MQYADAMSTKRTFDGASKSCVAKHFGIYIYIYIYICLCAQLKLNRTTTMDKIGIAVNKAVDHCKGGRPPTKRWTTVTAGSRQ